ncbi:MAG: hypothetical protein KGI57_08805 [Hyphomicrobiales bacterium]|nr:hypothetical protein [Hyphomicrobiales bacterium]MDE2017791.1 hypothetical protein [Hyphomicrobiales bacterium]
MSSSPFPPISYVLAIARVYAGVAIAVGVVGIALALMFWIPYVAAGFVAGSLSVLIARRYENQLKASAIHGYEVVSGSLTIGRMH